MTHVENTYAPHWLDGAKCRPPSHDHRTAYETDPERTERLIAAFFTCQACPVDHARCLQNGINLEADGIYGGVLLEGGKPVNPQRAKPGPKKATA